MAMLTATVLGLVRPIGEVLQAGQSEESGMGRKEALKTQELKLTFIVSRPEVLLHEEMLLVFAVLLTAVFLHTTLLWIISICRYAFNLPEIYQKLFSNFDKYTKMNPCCFIRTILVFLCLFLIMYILLLQTLNRTRELSMQSLNFYIRLRGELQSF